MEPFDSGYELLPPEGADMAVDEALEAALGGAIVPASNYEPAPLGRSWAFDFETGQFARGGGASPIVVTGEASPRMWVLKALHTARLAHPVYTEDYGVELPFDLVGGRVTPEGIGRYAAAVTDALLVHDRIAAVEDFAFSYDPDDDALEVAFAVVLDGGARVPVDPVSLGGF